jgi:hypothetical protein
VPNFKAIESLFSELLAAALELSESERDEVQRYVDHSEYGLALETAVDILSEEKKIPSDDVVSLIQRLARAMSIEPTTLLVRLPKPP